MKEDIESIRKRFEQADRQLYQAEQDIKILQRFIKQYKTMSTNMRNLESFYFSAAYIRDLEILEAEELDSDLWSTGQDAIWNKSVRYRSLVIELLKRVTDDIYESTTKIEG